MWGKGQPADPHAWTVGTPIGDGSSQVELIEPPATARDHVLHADEVPGLGDPVQVLVERTAEHAVDDDCGALDRPAASRVSGS